MQALLSRAVEEQVSEQRAVSTVLAELKDHVAALEAAVRGAAANESVERLEGSVSTVVADQRTATTLLSQRLEVLASRVEGLSALGTRVEAQAAALDQVERALEQFASFPEALSALQRDVSGVHDRLAPLAELRAAVGDLTARTTSSLDSLRPQLEALAGGAGSTGSALDPERVRDAVVDALATRLERLQQAAERPVVGPEVLRSGLGDMRAGVTAAVGQQLDTVQESITELGGRIDRLVERTGETGAAGEAFGDVTA
jgi:chromosome segregation ATPase